MAEYSTNITDLKVAIASILNQTYKNYEFIIVDDCGINDLKKVVDEFNDPRISIIKNDKNEGFVRSLNTAIEHSRGEYLVRMDTDDEVDPNRIQLLVNFIEKNPHYDVVSSRAIEFSGDEEFGIIGKQGEKGRKHVMRGDVPVHAASLIKKQAIKEVGGYKDYNRAEDLALWCDLLIAGKRLYMLDDVLYRYRVNRGDYKKRSLKYRKGELKARLYYYPKLGAGPLEYLRILKSIAAGIMPISAIRAYRNKFVTRKG